MLQCTAAPHRKYACIRRCIVSCRPINLFVSHQNAVFVSNPLLLVDGPRIVKEGRLACVARVRHVVLINPSYSCSKNRFHSRDALLAVDKDDRWRGSLPALKVRRYEVLQD